MKRKIGLILSIRNKSKRFPGKVLKKIFGKSTTEHLIQRLKMTSNFHKIIIGTSDDPRDKLFEEISVNNNIDCFFEFEGFGITRDFVHPDEGILGGKEYNSSIMRFSQNDHLWNYYFYFYI